MTADALPKLAKPGDLVRLLQILTEKFPTTKARHSLTLPSADDPYYTVDTVIVVTVEVNDLWASFGLSAEDLASKPAAALADEIVELIRCPM